ncbi:MAG: hypothetical protein R3F65_14755 [bacterium]
MPCHRGSIDLRGEADELGEPIDARSGSRWHPARAEDRERPAFDVGAEGAEAGHRADRARHLADDRPPFDLEEAGGVTTELVEPVGDLEAEGGRQGVLTMGAADHQPVAVPMRRVRERREARRAAAH